jgi:hypothetical protein
MITPRNEEPDFVVRNEGTIFLLCPLTHAARQWIDDNLVQDWTTFGGCVVVEHRYIGDIVGGMCADGLEVC